MPIDGSLMNFQKPCRCDIFVAKDYLGALLPKEHLRRIYLSHLKPQISPIEIHTTPYVVLVSCLRGRFLKK